MWVWKSSDASAYFGPGSGSEFEACPLPFFRLGSSSSYAAFSSADVRCTRQVEGTYEAEVAKTELPTDPLLLELYERRKVLYQTDTKWRSMAKLGVDCCFRDVGVEPLRRMERDSIRRVMKTVEVRAPARSCFCCVCTFVRPGQKQKKYFCIFDPGGG